MSEAACRQAVEDFLEFREAEFFALTGIAPPSLGQAGAAIAENPPFAAAIRDAWRAKAKGSEEGSASH
jgi:hypothetical protein